jgi:hypothetical protein
MGGADRIARRERSHYAMSSWDDGQDGQAGSVRGGRSVADIGVNTPDECVVALPNVLGVDPQREECMYGEFIRP